MLDTFSILQTNLIKFRIPPQPLAVNNSKKEQESYPRHRRHDPSRRGEGSTMATLYEDPVYSTVYTLPFS